ncbi:ubiquitin carboxyl-terminal hydrolase isozyme L1 [Cryptosporidium felis]|nr:ubiquitin carboxyl-terminal hydrolase isozyme L1 [Cryptosporidium felis]
MTHTEDKNIWKPLVSDPELLESYSSKLGAKTKMSFVDIYSFDESEVANYNQEPISILIVFPITQEMADSRGESPSDFSGLEEKIWFMRQYIPNSCGTIALLHSILNNQDKIELQEGSIAQELSKIGKVSGNISETRGRHLLNDVNIKKIHEEITSQDRGGECDYETDFHYTTLIASMGNIFELDGRLLRPIDHGEYRNGTFLKCALQIIKEKFISTLGEYSVAITAVYL